MTFVGVGGMTTITAGTHANDFHFISVDNKHWGRNILTTFRNITFSNIGALKAYEGKIKMDKCIFQRTRGYVYEAAIYIFNYNEGFRGNAEIDVQNTKIYGVQGLIYVRAHTVSVNVINCYMSQIFQISGAPVNAAVQLSGSHSQYGRFQLSVHNTVFKYFLKAIEVSYSQGNANPLTLVTIKNCSFVSNGPGYPYYARYFRYKGSALTAIGGLKITVNHSSFLSNQAQAGGAVYVEGSSVTFNFCMFSRNLATFSGGSIFVNTGEIKAFQCKFSKNTVNSSYSFYNVGTGDFQKGSGGAITLNSKGNGMFRKCYFLENSADVFGDSIFHSGNRLTLKNSLFESSASSEYMKQQKNEIIFSKSDAYLENVTIRHSSSSDVGRTMLFHNTCPSEGGKFSLMNAHKNVTIDCSAGWKVSQRSDYLFVAAYPDQGFKTIIVTCLPCPRNAYSLNAGSILFNVLWLYGHKISQITCHTCPFGSICRDGRIAAQDNFWGYADTAKGSVKFISCPSGYCCNKRQCVTYNSCSEGREGVLCGRCKMELSESVFTTACIKHALCKHTWFWFIALAAGPLYVLFFMYLKEIGAFVRVLILPKRFGKGRTSNTDENYVSFDNDERNMNDSSVDRMSDSESNQRRDLLRPLSLTNTRTTETVPESQSNLISGFIKILFFFYQTQALFKVSVRNEGFHKALELVKDILTGIFNFKVDGESSKIVWCPIKGLHPVGKSMLKATFVAYVVILVLLFKAFAVMVRKVKGLRQDIAASERRNKFELRLVNCSIQFILLGYNTLTVTLFSLVSCVNLFSSEDVLFIDGTITCYQWWQYVVFFVLGIFVIPFPMVILLAIKLLKQPRTSTKSVFSCLIFPLPYFLYWFVSSFLWKRRSSEQYQDNSTTANDDDSVLSQRPSQFVSSDVYNQEILLVLLGPFRKRNGLNKINSDAYNKLPWESIFIARRLILIGLYTLITNPVVRLYIMLAFTVVFFVHHALILPFSSRILNHAETCSLLFLTSLCAMNLLPAYVYVYSSTMTFIRIRQILKVFSVIESVILLGIPTIFVFGFEIIILVKVLFVVWKLIKLTLRCFRFFKLTLSNH